MILKRNMVRSPEPPVDSRQKWICLFGLKDVVCRNQGAIAQGAIAQGAIAQGAIAKTSTVVKIPL